MLLLWDRFSVSKTIIPEAQEHFLVSSEPRYTPSFGGSRLRLRKYPNRRKRAVHLIAEDLLGTSISANLAARRLDRGSVLTQPSTGRKSIPTAVSILVVILATAARVLVPILPKDDLKGLAESSQSSITILPAPIYFLPLVALITILILALARLRGRYQGWSINWNRTIFTTYVLVGLAAGCILFFGLESEKSIALGLWLGYLILLVAASAAFRIGLFFLQTRFGRLAAFTRRDFAILFFSTAISTSVILCGVVGIGALPDGWMDENNAKTTQEIAAYVFPFVTLLLVFAAMVTYPRWLDFRNTTRIHSAAMELSACRALTHLTQNPALAMNQLRISQIANEVGWRLGPSLFKTSITGCVMFLLHRADSAAGLNTTKWTDVSQFQIDVFESAILTTCLADFNVSETQHATGVEQGIITERSELVGERVRRIIAIRCARLIYGTHRRRAAGGVISVGEDTLMYAAGVADMVANYTQSLPTATLIQQHLRGQTFAEKVHGLLKGAWRLI